MAAMWKLVSIALVLVVNVLWPVHCADAAPMAHLVLHSEPGDFIGGGSDHDITYTPDNSDFFFANVLDFGLPGPAYVDFSLGTVTCCSDNTFAFLTFGTNQLGIPLAPGGYADAERAPFASPGHPGLDVGFQNRGCNTLTGSFVITEALFSDAATAATGSPVDRFAATFEQHCEGGPAALFGTFSYRAFAVPEPATWLLIAAALPLLARRPLRIS
jgi:hypothetical protein